MPECSECQPNDPYTQLVLTGARWYEGRIGRWVSADAIVPDPTDPQTLNRLAYVRGNPLSHVDPSGHGFPLPVIGKIDVSGWHPWAVVALRVALTVVGGRTTLDENTVTVYPGITMPVVPDIVVAPEVTALGNVVDDAIARQEVYRFRSPLDACIAFNTTFAAIEFSSAADYVWTRWEPPTQWDYASSKADRVRFACATLELHPQDVSHQCQALVRYGEYVILMRFWMSSECLTLPDVERILSSLDTTMETALNPREGPTLQP